MIYLLLFLVTVPVFGGNVQDYLYQKLHVEFLQKCELKNCNRNKRLKKKKLRRYSDTDLLRKSTNNAYKKKIAKQLGWL